MTTRKSLAWSFAQQLSQYVIQFTGSVIIARLLLPSEVGIFSLAMAASWMLAGIRQFGVTTYLIREPELTRAKIQSAFGIMIIVSWSLGATLFFSRGWLAQVYEAPGIADVLTIATIGFILAPFGQPAQALLTRDMRFDLLHHITLATAICSASTSVVMAYLGHSYMALAYGLLVATILQTSFLLLARPDHALMLPRLSHWREIANFGGFMTAANLMGTFNLEGPKFILGGLISPAGLAIYERTTQLPTIIQEGLFLPIGRVLIPSFSQAIREKRPIEDEVEQLIGATTAIIWPAFMCIGLLSVPIIIFLFGENWRKAGELLPWVLFAWALLALVPVPEHILAPHGKVRRLFAARAIALLSNLGLTVAGALHSLDMFVMLRPLESGLTATIFLYALRPVWSPSGLALGLLYLKALVIMAICSLPAGICLIVFGQDVPFSGFLMVALASILMWAISLFLVRHPLRHEIMKLVKAVRQRTQQRLRRRT